MRLEPLRSLELIRCPFGQFASITRVSAEQSNSPAIGKLLNKRCCHQSVTYAQSTKNGRKTAPAIP